ncbi:MAG: lipoprotein [Hydrogenophaga sp.]|nr:lipoprotein [Hydrogenophaga sp.]
MFRWLRILGFRSGPARAMALALCLSSLAACGQKGRLYLPPPPSADPTTQPTHAPARAPDASPR